MDKVASLVEKLKKIAEMQSIGEYQEIEMQVTDEFINQVEAGDLSAEFDLITLQLPYECDNGNCICAPPLIQQRN